MPAESFSERDLQILEHIESNPDATQSTLAEHLGVAIGTVNFVVRRMIDKGYIRAKRLERKRLKYIITPQGISVRAKMAMISIDYSMRLYRETRTKTQKLLAQVRRTGYDSVCVEGQGDIADVVRLTCLEQGVDVVTRGDMPVIKIEGTQIKLNG